MTYELFPHQIKGADFLASSKGTKGLFFGMGTGKTVTALEAATRVDPGLCLRKLIIAPPIALPMWKTEAEGYTGGRADIIKTGKAPIPAGADTLILSYQIATSRKDELRDWLNGGILICDESHALKSPGAKRTRAILGNRGIADGADYTWLLTGTPITRWNDDMYTFLCRADLKGMRKEVGGITLERFQLKYCVRQQKQWPGARFPVWMVVGNQQTAELAEWVYGEGHALRVDLKEVFENMPPITHRRYDIDIDGDAVLKSKLKQLEKMSIEEIRQQKESLSGLRRELGVAKVQAAAIEILDRIKSGQNILVAAWHTEVIDGLYEKLEGACIDSKAEEYVNAEIIDGRNPNQRDDIVEAWNRGEIQVLIGQTAAMGVSLNLQKGGSQIIVVEEDWSPSIMDQMYARLWRYGQEKHVHVDTLTTNTKLDKAIGRISANKEREHAKFNAIGRELT